mmetsp:Transcript_2728/g.3869  ORF Transcript_2728/g.3869 Transcript_2728/m.3869 type:complete len:210 (+) Transcript_2728:165-794(+)
MPSYQNNTKGPCDEETSKLVVQIKQDVEESSSSTKSYLGFGFAALLVVVLLGTAASSAGGNRPMEKGLSLLGYYEWDMLPENADFCAFAEDPPLLSEYAMDAELVGITNTCHYCLQYGSFLAMDFGDCYLGYYRASFYIPKAVTKYTKTSMEDCPGYGEYLIQNYENCISRLSYTEDICGEGYDCGDNIPTLKRCLNYFFNEWEALCSS